MKQQNKIILEQDDWKLEKLELWPISANYHHQGWCTSTDKDEFDSYKERGDLWVLFKPKDRATRPSYQIFISEYGSSEVMGSGNRNSSLAELKKLTPKRISEWFDARISDQNKKSANTPVSDGVAEIFPYATDRESISPLRHPYERTQTSIRCDGSSLIHSLEYCFQGDGYHEFRISTNHAVDVKSLASDKIMQIGALSELDVDRYFSTTEVSHKLLVDKVNENRRMFITTVSKTLSTSDDGFCIGLELAVYVRPIRACREPYAVGNLVGTIAPLDWIQLER